MMKLNPKEIKKHDEKTMLIVWNNNEQSLIPFVNLRYHCECAECVDEWTRQRKIKKESIDPNVKPKLVELVGRYAIQIYWSDGHKAGIYPFELLYEIAKKQN